MCANRTLHERQRPLMMRNAGVRLLSVVAWLVCASAFAQDYVPVNLQLLTAARAGDLAAVQRLLGDGAAINARNRSEEHTSELQSHSDLHSFPTRRSSDLGLRPGQFATAHRGARR